MAGPLNQPRKIMLIRRALLSLLISAPVAASLCGCGADFGPRPVDDEGEVAFRDAELVNEACQPDIQVGKVTPGSPCPSVAGWNRVKLFRDSLWLGENYSPPEELGAFCRYEWKGGAKVTTKDVNRLRNKVPNAEPDCLAVFGEGDELSDVTVKLLEPAYHDAIRWADASALELPGAGDAYRSPTQMYVVDTSSYYNVNMNSEHGVAMKRLAEDIACPAGANGCAIAIDSALGMPRLVDRSRDEIQGGFYGTTADAAAGLVEAGERWFQANASLPTSQRSRLVVNLSLGFDGTFFNANDPNAMGPPVEAVRVALEVLSCRDVLVVAAAGNQWPDVCSEGALAPAMWEEWPGPDAIRCAELGISPAAHMAVSRPLVNAAGGLSFGDRAMPGSRIDGRPRMGVAADHVVLTNPLTPIYTGTSISAAVMSATAALVFSYNPTLTAKQVADLIYDSGRDTLDNADFEFGTKTSKIRALDVCAAIEKTCDGRACSALPLANCMGTPDPGALQSILDTIAAVPITEPPIAPKFVNAQCAASCGQTRLSYFSAGAVCETRRPSPAARLSTPQPLDPLCGVCGLTNDTVTLAVSDAYADEEIESLTVDIFDGTVWSEWHSLDADEIVFGRAGEFQLSPPPPATTVEASITVTLVDGRSRTDPLLYTP